MNKYTVKENDTLYGIAKETLGNGSRYPEIAKLNEIDSPHDIKPGIQLLIPERIANASEYNAITKEQLEQIMPDARESNINKYLEHLNEYMAKNEINTPLRQAHFLAQIGHESGSLNRVTENLNYSAQGLRSTFGK